MKHRASPHGRARALACSLTLLAGSVIGRVGVVAALGGTVGCGTESDDREQNVARGSSEAADPSLDRFSPDIANTYDGDMAEPGLEVVAHTIREHDGENQYLVAVENTGSCPICMLELSSTFTDFQGNVVAAGMTTLRTPLYHSTRQMGLSTLVLSNLVRCLGPGEIAMAQDTEILADVYAGMIAAVRHDFSGFAQSGVVPAEDVGLSGVKATIDTSGLPVFTGRVENGSFQAIEATCISVFAINAVGRPVAVTEASGPGRVVVGDALDFEVIGDFRDEFEDFLVYLVASSL
jgi:hypothetical protein